MILPAPRKHKPDGKRNFPKSADFFPAIARFRLSNG
jgi:hypothetical protein